MIAVVLETDARDGSCVQKNVSDRRGRGGDRELAGGAPPRHQQPFSLQGTIYFASMVVF